MLVLLCISSVNIFLAKEDGMLKNWIEEALKSDCGLNNFANNRLKDYDAVNNAVIRTISNGQVEGQVNRIKNIKRKMYGKAGFQRLRKMVTANQLSSPKVMKNHFFEVRSFTQPGLS